MLAPLHSIPVTANLPPPRISCHLTALQSDSGRVTRPDRLLSGELVRQQPLPLISPGAHPAELLPNAAVAAPAAPAAEVGTAPTTGANQPLSTGLGFCRDFTYQVLLLIPQRLLFSPSSPAILLVSIRMQAAALPAGRSSPKLHSLPSVRSPRDARHWRLTRWQQVLSPVDLTVPLQQAGSTQHPSTDTPRQRLLLVLNTLRLNKAGSKRRSFNPSCPAFAHTPPSLLCTEVQKCPFLDSGKCRSGAGSHPHTQRGQEFASK